MVYQAINYISQYGYHLKYRFTQRPMFQRRKVIKLMVCADVRTKIQHHSNERKGELASNNALNVVLPIDSLISICFNGGGAEGQRKIANTRESKRTRSWLTFARLRSLGMRLAIGIGVSRDVGKWDCIETNGTGTMNHRTSKARSEATILQPHHWTPRKHRPRYIKKRFLSAFSIFSLTNSNFPTVHLCEACLVAWLERVDYKSLLLRELCLDREKRKKRKKKREEDRKKRTMRDSSLYFNGTSFSPRILPSMRIDSSFVDDAVATVQRCTVYI